VDTLFEGAGIEPPDRALVMAEREAYRRRGQGNALEGFFGVGELRGRLAQKLAPGRGVEIKIPDVNRGARRQRCRLGVADRSPAGLYFPCMRAVRRLAGQRQMRDRGDRRQRLAAKPERGDCLQIFQASDLAGGVARQRKRQFFPGDALAVVGDTDAADAALDQLHGDIPCAGIEAVFQQFFQGRCRALDHLSSGNLADQQVGKDVDLCHYLNSIIEKGSLIR
jgi:hypothetical protein